MNEEKGCYSVKVHPKFVTSYFQYFGGRSQSTVNSFLDSDSLISVPSWKSNFKSNKRNIFLSKTSLKKIRLAVDYMVFLSKPKKIYNFKTKTYFWFNLNFFTATLSSPQIHSDLIIKRDILQPFLSWLRQAYKCDRYIWRLEKQQNGRSHFHLILDKYIPWWVLRSKWNYYQENLGYISRYVASGGNMDPNSTDIHSIRKIRDISAYITKYITKSEQDEKSIKENQGRIWAVSESLSNLKGNPVDVDSQISEELIRISNLKGITSYSKDYFTVWHISTAMLKYLKCEALLRSFDQYVSEHFNPN